MKKFKWLGVLGLSVILAGCTLGGGVDQINMVTIKDKLSGESVEVVMSPEQTVENYMKATLGSLPNSDYDEEVAKTYLEEELRAQFTDARFIPMSYAIQDGPDKVETIDQEIIVDEATIVVKGYWGADLTMNWMFSLVKIDGVWLITEINPGQ